MMQILHRFINVVDVLWRQLSWSTDTQEGDTVMSCGLMDCDLIFKIGEECDSNLCERLSLVSIKQN